MNSEIIETPQFRARTTSILEMELVKLERPPGSGFVVSELGFLNIKGGLGRA